MGEVLRGSTHHDNLKLVLAKLFEQSTDSPDGVGEGREGGKGSEDGERGPIVPSSFTINDQVVVTGQGKVVGGTVSRAGATTIAARTATDAPRAALGACGRHERAGVGTCGRILGSAREPPQARSGNRGQG